MRNILATLFLSQGVPMLQAGDEFARQRSAATTTPTARTTRFPGVDWHLRSVNQDLLRFVRLLARLRRRHVEFRRETFLKGRGSRAPAVKDVTWLNAGGTEMKQSEWQDCETCAPWGSGSASGTIFKGDCCCW